MAGVAESRAGSFRVSIPTQLRAYTGGAADVDVRVDALAPTLADLLGALDAAYPGIRFRMQDEAGRIRPHVQVFVNGCVNRDPATALPDAAVVMIVGALSGG